MKIAIIATAIACAFVAATSALPTDSGPAGEIVGDIDPDDLAGTQCTTAGGKTLGYIPGGNFAALSDVYMNGTLAVQNCGKCVKATTKSTNGSVPKSMVFTVIGNCEGCADNSFFTHPTTLAKLTNPNERFVDDAIWSFVPCPVA
ncbi:hypothetical protein H4R19_004969 [Coemansia spiralis]|nr:hypothetical protein H4R19_004969 [Coemansia spiralis]